jgi:hypothetical protein
MWRGIDADVTTRKGTTTGSELAGMTNAVPLDVAGVVPAPTPAPTPATPPGSLSSSTAAPGSPDP